MDSNIVLLTILVILCVVLYLLYVLLAKNNSATDNGNTGNVGGTGNTGNVDNTDNTGNGNSDNTGNTGNGDTDTTGNTGNGNGGSSSSGDQTDHSTEPGEEPPNDETKGPDDPVEDPNNGTSDNTGGGTTIDEEKLLKDFVVVPNLTETVCDVKSRIKALTTNSIGECAAACKTATTCAYFSFQSATSTCILSKDTCIQTDTESPAILQRYPPRLKFSVDKDAGPGVVAFSKLYTKKHCGVNQRVKFKRDTTLLGCEQLCNATKYCNFITFNSRTKLCNIYDSCNPLNASDVTNIVYGKLSRPLGGPKPVDSGTPATPDTPDVPLPPGGDKPDENGDNSQPDDTNDKEDDTEDDNVILDPGDIPVDIPEGDKWNPEGFLGMSTGDPGYEYGLGYAAIVPKPGTEWKPPSDWVDVSKFVATGDINVRDGDITGVYMTDLYKGATPIQVTSSFGTFKPIHWVVPTSGFPANYYPSYRPHRPNGTRLEIFYAKFTNYSLSASAGEEFRKWYIQEYPKASKYRFFWRGDYKDEPSATYISVGGPRSKTLNKTYKNRLVARRPKFKNNDVISLCIYFYTSGVGFGGGNMATCHYGKRNTLHEVGHCMGLWHSNKILHYKSDPSHYYNLFRRYTGFNATCMGSVPTYWPLHVVNLLNLGFLDSREHVYVVPGNTYKIRRNDNITSDHILGLYWRNTMTGSVSIMSYEKARADEKMRLLAVYQQSPIHDMEDTSIYDITDKANVPFLNTPYIVSNDGLHVSILSVDDKFMTVKFTFDPSKRLNEPFLIKYKTTVVTKRSANTKGKVKVSVVITENPKNADPKRMVDFAGITGGNWYMRDVVTGKRYTISTDSKVEPIRYLFANFKKDGFYKRWLTKISQAEAEKHPMDIYIDCPETGSGPITRRYEFKTAINHSAADILDITFE